MKKFIKNKLRFFLKEEIIHTQKINPLGGLCDAMTVNNYNEIIKRITLAIGTKQKNPKLWAKIEKPLKQLKIAIYKINKEKHTNQFGSITADNKNMTGDSIPDEVNTYWTMIQSTLCS
jgi:hypothetical protein